MVPLSLLIVLDRHAAFVLHDFRPTFSKVSELADHWLMAPRVGNFVAICFLAIMVIANEDVRGL